MDTARDARTAIVRVHRRRKLEGRATVRKSVIAATAALALLATLAVPVLAAGFDQYGYNDTARVFVGPASGWCLAAGSTSDCMGIYSNDLLVMKWNAAWDACNLNGYDDPTYCLGAWLTNEWNGKVPGGSGQVWHYKIIWVGSAGSDSQYWVPGGYSIWGNYEVIMDQGIDPNIGPGHMWFALGTPNGFGVHS